MSQSKAKVVVTGDDGTELGRVTVAVTRADGAKATVIIAHGAGGTMDTPSIVGLQTKLAANGITAARFNFLYSEMGKRAPDSQPALLAVWRSVADWVKNELEPKKLFLSGRSMGGRMASYLVAEGYPCDGIVFLAYPLHPPGKPDRQRKDHLPKIKVPTLFVSGSRDAFARLDLLEPVVEKSKAKLHVIEGADHGFKVPKKSGRAPKEVEDEVVATLIEFMSGGG